MDQESLLGEAKTSALLLPHKHILDGKRSKIPQEGKFQYTKKCTGTGEFPSYTHIITSVLQGILNCKGKLKKLYLAVSFLFDCHILQRVKMIH